MVNVSSATTATALQKLFDKYGEDTYSFGKNQSISVDCQLNIDGGVTLEGKSQYSDMPIFKLINEAPESLFGSQDAIIEVTGADNSINGIIFNGNDTKQLFKRGKGYHNFVHLLKTDGFTSDLLYVENSLGDGIRGKAANNTEITRMRVNDCGHDCIFIEESKNVTVHDSIFFIRTNTGTRYRAVENGYFFRNYIENKHTDGISTGPGVQLENSKTTTTAKNYQIHDNYFKNTDGPGMWIICTYATSKTASSGLEVCNNTFENCGKGGHYSNASSTGGICVDGWNGTIHHNLFNGCRSGVTVGPWISIKPAGSGYEIQIKNNMFTGITSGKQSYSTAGTAIDKTTKVSTSIICGENYFYRNLKDYYSTGETTQVDPKLESVNGLYFISSESALYGRGIGSKAVNYTYESNVLIEDDETEETNDNGVNEDPDDDEDIIKIVKVIGANEYISVGPGTIYKEVTL